VPTYLTKLQRKERFFMPLAIERKAGQSIIIDDTIVYIERVGQSKVMILIDAPEEIEILRGEFVGDGEKKIQYGKHAGKPFTSSATPKTFTKNVPRGTNQGGK
jgi:sRNA-binding carbon storage regulator CsrA